MELYYAGTMLVVIIFVSESEHLDASVRVTATRSSSIIQILINSTMFDRITRVCAWWRYVNNISTRVCAWWRYA